MEPPPAAKDVLRGYAAERKARHLPHAGDVTPEEAWAYVSSFTDGCVVDVRSSPEWQFVGEPDLREAKGRLLKNSWKTYPTFALNPAFAEQLSRDVPRRDAVLFFLCRSGGRSLDAAVAASAMGYEYCFNVLDGFEGEPDEASHRNVQGGWKALGLPWRQG